MKNILKTVLLLAGVSAGWLCSYANEPAGYYRSLEGKSDGELKTAICQLIRNFTQVSSYQDLPKYFQRTDVYPNSKRWWDMYSDIPLYAPSFKGLNREHSFPKSWWGGDTGIPAYVDLNHLYPSEQAANMAKSNYPLGEVNISNTPKFDNGVSKVGYPVTGLGGGSQWVFEPDDEYKGDFARTYFYMVTCYQNLTWSTKYDYMMSSNAYPTLKGWASKMLLEWSRRDPVSDKEKERNEQVYNIQNNRNPFIDRPELAEYIWGDKMGQPYHVGSTEPAGNPVLITPTQGMSLDFGQVAIGQSTTARLFFHGENLTGSLDLALSGTNRKMFSLPSSSLSTSLVNAPGGTWLTITYKPTELGRHTGKLIISEGGILGGSRGVALIGECLDVPVLTACTATEATDITGDSYRANWISPENETVDYWIVNRTKFVNGNATSEEILAEEPGIIIEGFDQSDSESYSVQSVRLGYRSPASNIIFVGHDGITGIEAERGLEVQGFDGCLRFVCDGTHTGVCIYDISGKLVIFLASVSNNTDVDIAPGIYFITTDQLGSPVKVVVK